MNLTEEKQLLTKIKENPKHFGALFDAHYKPIFNYIFRRVGDYDISRDIAADTFLKAYLKVQSFVWKDISVLTWLYRIATNEVNLYFRQKQKTNSLFERFDLADKELFNNYLSEDRIELEMELQKHKQFLAVLEGLKTLPVKYQEVISLRYFEGKDYKEITEILNINEGTLKSLLSRGVEKLRKKCNQL